MKKKNIFYSILLLAFLSSCGVPQAEYDKLKLEKEQLIAELDECINGEERLVATIEKAYTEEDYTLAKESIAKLYKNHPESPNNDEFQRLLSVIEKKIQIEIEKKEAEEREKIRLENMDNTGIWSVGYYVDDFGEPTKEGYIRNTSYITGTFSNTATQDSELNVKFLISNSSDISIQLYEYAGNNPVKSYSSESYTILIQDKDGKRLKLKAENYSERLTFDKAASRQVHNVLMKGGSIKFKIVEIDTPTTIYKFTIGKSDWYDNAYRKLKES